MDVRLRGRKVDGFALPLDPPSSPADLPVLKSVERAKDDGDIGSRQSTAAANDGLLVRSQTRSPNQLRSILDDGADPARQKKANLEWDVALNLGSTAPGTLALVPTVASEEA